ncbi:nascent polypeptide-associated complex protein [Candidatus Woesearchaeota archaeon]|nr:nascent polypeptide-associated complex protein [Candidatus Woesearchaeota archaeon]
MIPGINPKDMARAMKKLGMKQEELNVKKVVMTLDDKELIFENPQVLKVDMMGQESYQLTGESVERALELQISEEDIKTVMEQTSTDRNSALKAIKSNNGDLAAAILELQEK